MTYNADLDWAGLAGKAASHSANLINQLNQGMNEYNEWQSFRAGRTNAVIGTALSRTETEVAELDACFAAHKALYDYANNQTPTQSDYFYSLRIFA